MSIKEFNFATKNYKSYEYPETSFMKAKQEWDDRIGSARVQAKNWRLCALGLTCLSILLTIGLISVSSKSRVTPYVVQLNPDGSVQAVGPAREMNYTLKEPEIKYFLSQFVQKTRSLPLDAAVAKQNWIVAYAFLSQSGAIKMNAIAAKENPFQKLGQESKQVKINVVVAISKNSYQVRWNESIFNSQGAPVDDYKMTGIFTITYIEPKTEKEILENPLGIYIKDFSWSKEL